MQIQLAQFFVRNLHFEQILEPIEGAENNFELNFIASFYKQRPKEFFVEFDINLKSAKEFICKFNYIFLFSINEEITDEFMKSHFPVINAPAIAFPYLRAFVSNFTLNAGYLPMIMPSINFMIIDKNVTRVFLDGELISGTPLIAQ